MTAPSPETLAGGVAAFAVTANCAPIDPSWQVVAVDVWLELGGARARVVILDGDPATGAFPVSDSPVFAPGAPIAIALGYDDALTQVFVGMVERQGIALDGDGAAQLLIDAAGPAVKGKGGAPVLTLTWGESLSVFEAGVGADGAVRGSAWFQGSALVLPGCSVTLAGLGARFNGDAGVRQVHQRIADGLWHSAIDLGPVPVHKLGKLDVRLSVADGEDQGAIRQRVEALARDALPAALERAFDALGLGDHVVRIDRLDIDLGRFDAEGLEDALPAALEAAVARALTPI